METCPHCDQDLEAEFDLAKAEKLAKDRAAEIVRLRAALKPFANFAGEIERDHPGWYHHAFAFTDPRIPMTWLIAAREAFGNEQKAPRTDCCRAYAMGAPLCKDCPAAYDNQMAAEAGSDLTRER